MTKFERILFSKLYSFEELNTSEKSLKDVCKYVMLNVRERSQDFEILFKLYFLLFKAIFKFFFINVKRLWPFRE